MQCFAGDDEFCHAARRWAMEEVQHGEVPRRWVEIADPAFDFHGAFTRVTEGYQLPLQATASVRGSRTGELIALCVVEVGTSSYYSALADSTAEPVLAALCRRIAGDEFRHYKLFLDHVRRYQASEWLGLWRRLRVALGRLIESEDDELAFAYYCGTPTVDAGDPAPYDRKRSIRAYGGRTLTLYRFGHVERALRMVFKAVGLAPRGPLQAWSTAIAWRRLRLRARQLAAAT